MSIFIQSSLVFHLGFPSQCSSKNLKSNSENHSISSRCRRSSSSTLRRNVHNMNTKQRQMHASSSSSSSIDFQKLSSSIFQMGSLYNDKRLAEKMYDESISFQDPITCVDSLHALLIYFDLMKFLFHISAKIHQCKQTGPYEITTRWTMVMKFVLLPWGPELVFTGTSVLGINPNTQKICSHVDIWDSLEKNDYFSLEALVDVIKQMQIYKTPDFETPKYQILKRTSNYEVRKYDPFDIAETKVVKLSDLNGFNNVAGRYIFGKNSSTEKIPMTTTPVFTQAFDTELAKTSIQVVVLPPEKDLNISPKSNKEELCLRKLEGGLAVVSKFSGNPTEDIVRKNERCLRMASLKDGLKPKQGCLFAGYNDPNRTWDFIMRNEVLIWLEEFTLD